MKLWTIQRGTIGGCVFRLSALLCALAPGCVNPPPDYGWKCMVEVQTNAPGQAWSEADRATTIKLLERRLRRLGDYKPRVASAGENLFSIMVPGARSNDVGILRKAVTSAGHLEFRLVHENSAGLLKMDIIEPGYEVLQREHADPDGARKTESFLVKKKPAGPVTGRNLKNVRADRDAQGRLYIAFELDAPGGEAFAKLTRENVDRLLAIVVDGKLISAPYIKEEILGGSVSIDGGAQGFSAVEAFELMKVLENPLPAPLRIIEEQSY
jgi:preprotein translocase subunit SecD